MVNRIKMFNNLTNLHTEWKSIITVYECLRKAGLSKSYQGWDWSTLLVMEEQQDRKEGEGRKGQRALSGSRLAFRLSCILTALCIMGRTKGLNKPGLLNRNRTWLRAVALPIPITVINSPPLRFKVLPPLPTIQQGTHNSRTSNAEAGPGIRQQRE